MIMNNKLTEKRTIKVHDTVADMMQQYNELGGIRIRDIGYDQGIYYRQVLN
jgi:hypothetical protein